MLSLHRHSRPIIWLTLLCVAALVAVSGCRNATQLYYADRLDRGYTIVAPGVVGRTPFNAGLVGRLKNAPTAVELHDWTSQTPVYKRRGLDGNPDNQREADEIVSKIVAYQDQYPGRPVHLVGLCAGTGIVSLALKRLPPDRRVTSVVFLAPALSAGYDFDQTVQRTELGVHSYHSPFDVWALVGFTTLFGTIDGRHGPAAGAFGFRVCRETSNRPLGRRRLHDHSYNLSMLLLGHNGGHYGWTSKGFVDQYLIPHLSAESPERNRISELGGDRTAAAAVPTEDFMVTGYRSVCEPLPPITWEDSPSPEPALPKTRRARNVPSPRFDESLKPLMNSGPSDNPRYH